MNTSLAVRLGALVVAAAVVAAFALWRRQVDGRARAARTSDALSAVEIGEALGDRLTLVQFSSPVCGPCAIARRHLSAAATQNPGVVHVELDVTEQLDLVRRLQVHRTPTTLCLDSDGRVIARITGVPTPKELTTLTEGSQEVAA